MIHLENLVHKYVLIMMNNKKFKLNNLKPAK